MSYGPKEVVSSIDNSTGGILDASCPGQLPRNEQQILNFKRYAPLVLDRNCLANVSQ